jgi:ESCRT-II complex subunit VPS22
MLFVVCHRRPVNGGMIELGALRAAVSRRRGSRSDPVSEDDIIRAIKKLKVSHLVESTTSG